MKLLLPALLCAIIAAASGAVAATASLGDRIGKIVAAEFTAAPVDIGDRDDSAVPVKFADERYIVVVLRLDARRSLSLVDYTLSINGASWPCVAAARNQEPFVSNPEALYSSGSDAARLLFVVDGAQVKPVDGTLTATLQPKLKGRSPVTFAITDLGSRPFTDPGKIPAEGLLPQRPQ